MSNSERKDLKRRTPPSTTPFATRRGPNRAAIPRPSGTGGKNIGADISDEAIAFGRALDQFKRTNHRPYPSVSDVLAVLKSLGYKRDGFDADGSRVLHPERVAACVAALDGVKTDDIGAFMMCVRRAMVRVTPTVLVLSPEDIAAEVLVALRVKQDVAAAKKWVGG